MSLKDFILSRLFLKNLAMAVLILIGVVIMTLVWLNFYTRHGQAKPVPDFTGLTIEQAVKLAKQNKLRFHIVDSVFTSVVPRGCIAEQNPRPGFKVKKWRNIILIVNALNPEMTAMPDLVDLPKRQALSIIESSGLETGTLRYVPDLSIDVVISQLHNGREVAAGDSLQKGSVIDLVLGKGLSNQRTSVPNLIGLTLRPATDKILGASLNLGTFIYDNTINTGDDTARAFVYKQNPDYSLDATLQLGSAIYLWMTVDSARLPDESATVGYDTVQVSVNLPDN